MKAEDFVCDKCGLCCKHPPPFKNNKEIQQTLPKWLHKVWDEFPYKIINGRCEKLTKDNLCSAYENRPLMCNLKKLFHSQTVYSEEEFYTAVHEGCSGLKRRASKKQFIDSLIRILIP